MVDSGTAALIGAGIGGVVTVVTSAISAWLSNEARASEYQTRVAEKVEDNVGQRERQRDAVVGQFASELMATRALVRESWSSRITDGGSQTLPKEQWSVLNRTAGAGLMYAQPDLRELVLQYITEIQGAAHDLLNLREPPDPEKLLQTIDKNMVGILSIVAEQR